MRSILAATAVALFALVILAVWIGARRQDRALTADLARLRASACGRRSPLAPTRGRRR